MIHSRLQARRLFLSLICLELLLLVIYSTDALIQGPSQPLHPVIDLDAEGNLPAWFSSFQLTLIAICLWTLSVRHRATQRPSRYFLRLWAVGFLLLSIDETALLHERITQSVGLRYIDWVPGYLGDHTGEVIVCVAVLLVCLRLAHPHLQALWSISREASVMAVAGLIILGTGAAVLESIGYRFFGDGSEPTLYRAEVAAEEFFEMAGASFVLYSVLLFACAKERNSLPTGRQRFASAAVAI